MIEKMHFGYERLFVWKEAKSLTVAIYELTRSFPEDEKFGLSSQLRRSIASVTYNLAEGSTRVTKREQARFVEIAFGSLIESASQLDVAKDLFYLDIESHKSLKMKYVKLSHQIIRYRKGILQREDIT
ncbi:MAG: four helix bundle protein [Saprospiraceae bacterium]|nr:four helix bundle protein [Saprospiraceae bacterium]